MKEIKEKIRNELIAIAKLNEKVDHKHRGVSVAAILYDVKNNKIYSNVNKKTSEPFGNEYHCEHTVLNRVSKESEVVIFITVSPCDLCAKKIKEYKVTKILYLIRNVRNQNLFMNIGIETEQLKLNQKIDVVNRYVKHFEKHQNKPSIIKRYGYSVKYSWDNSKLCYLTTKVTNN